jgi:hypothetical protein
MKVNMARPKKKHGWRQISVRDTAFLWKFDANAEYRHLRLGIQPEHAPNEAIEIVLFENEPHIVTPKFVQQAIEFALDNGWLGAQKVEKMSVIFAPPKFFMHRKSEVWKLKLSDLKG